MGLISLTEYAKRHNREPISMRQKAQRGGFRTAQKIGRNWVIDEDDPLTDNRIKSGAYIGAHANRSAPPITLTEADEDMRAGRVTPLADSLDEIREMLESQDDQGGTYTNR